MLFATNYTFAQRFTILYIFETQKSTFLQKHFENVLLTPYTPPTIAPIGAWWGAFSRGNWCVYLFHR